MEFVGNSPSNIDNNYYNNNCDNNNNDNDNNNNNNDNNNNNNDNNNNNNDNKKKTSQGVSFIVIQLYESVIIAIYHQVCFQIKFCKRSKTLHTT